jgi:hypothetical protein
MSFRYAQGHKARIETGKLMKIDLPTILERKEVFLFILHRLHYLITSSIKTARPNKKVLGLLPL